MITTGIVPLLRKRSTSPSVSSAPTPEASAPSEARWISGPSAIGSEKGMPISIARTPRRSRRHIISSVASSEGKPAVRKGMRPVVPRPAAKARPRRFPSGIDSAGPESAEGVVRKLERRAEVPVMDLDLEVRERPVAGVQALEEERPAAPRGVRAECVPEAHVHPQWRPELVAEARDLERLGPAAKA